MILKGREIMILQWKQRIAEKGATRDFQQGVTKEREMNMALPKVLYTI